MHIHKHSKLNVSPDVSIYPLDNGAKVPSFVIENVKGKRFEVSEAVVKLINRLDGTRSVGDVHRELTVGYENDTDISETIGFIEKYLLPMEIFTTDKPEQKVAADKEERPAYMWFKMSLLKPEWINSLTGMLSLLYHPLVMGAMLTFSTVTHFFFYLKWMNPGLIDADYIFSSKFLIIYVCVNLGSMFHELGHASALKRYNQDHGTIGFGFYLFMVVLYTNVSNAWRLKRGQRVVVNMGGMYFELIWMLGMLLLYALTGDTIFLIIHFLMDIKILFNLMPYFRMDGYWLVSDASGISNLREKSTAVLLTAVQKLWQSTPFPEFWYRLKKYQQIILMVYSSTSTLFFVWVGIRLIETSMTFLNSLPVEWNKIYALGNANHISLKQLYFQFGYLFGKLMLIAFTLFFFANIIKKSGRFFKSLRSGHV